MRKNFSIAILVVIIVLCLSACDGNTKSIITTQNANSEPIAWKIDNKSRYQLKDCQYNKKDTKMDVSLKYPELSEMSNKDLQKAINETLKDEALKVLRYYENPYGFVEININYKVIIVESNVLSIQYSGNGEASSAAHPNNLFYTTNIDLKTGNRIRLKDIIKVDDKFAEEFLNGKFLALWPEQNEARGLYSTTDIVSYFTEADSLDNIGTDKQSDVFTYFTLDSLGISISVGHAIGDHAEFEIKYKDIEKSMKTELGIRICN